MIREYCDSCQTELERGGNVVSERIKGDVFVNGKVIGLELILGVEAERTPGSRELHKVTWNNGHLCRVCAVRILLFAATGCDSPTNPFHRETPKIESVPKYVRKCTDYPEPCEPEARQ